MSKKNGWLSDQPAKLVIIDKITKGGHRERG
jgi:hypothetical protein